MSTREVIQPSKGEKRYARRDAQGQFTDSQVHLGRSLAVDRRSKSKTVAPKGQGRPRRSEEKLTLRSALLQDLKLIA